MKIAYCNCANGVAGDMFIAACLDAGVSPARLENMLKRQLRLTDWRLKTAVTDTYHYPARTVQVVGERTFRSPAEMLRIIRASTLPAAVRQKSLQVLQLLIAAEAAVHRVPVRKAHFHELNSIDTIIDITGACMALSLLGVEKLVASPVNTGAVAPATARLLSQAGVPFYADTHEHELTTPTGSAIVAGIAAEIGAMPLLAVTATGYGAGTKIIPCHENVLHLLVGNTVGQDASVSSHEPVIMLETTLDDLDPRVYPYVMERLLQAGAHDAWLVPVIMKKGRPGTQLSVVAPPDTETALAEIIFTETTTLGIRRSVVSRLVLERSGNGKTKTARLPGGSTRTRIEYEHARQTALRRKLPLRTLLD